MPTAAVRACVAVLLLAHELHSTAVSPRPSLARIPGTEIERESPGAGHDTEISTKISSQISPLFPGEKFPASSNSSVGGDRIETPRRLFELASRDETPSSKKLLEKLSNKFEGKKWQASLQRLDGGGSTPSNGRSPAVGCGEEVASVCPTDVRLPQNKTWEKEEKITSPSQQTGLTYSKSRIAGQPSRGKFKSQRNQGPHFGREIPEKRRTIPKMLPDIGRDKNSDAFKTRRVLTAPGASAGATFNSTVSSRDRGLEKPREFLKTQTSGSSFEHKFVGKISNYDRVKENFIGAQGRISSRHKFDKRTKLSKTSPRKGSCSEAESGALKDTSALNVLEAKSLRKSGDDNSEANVEEFQEEAFDKTQFEGTQSDSKNYQLDDTEQRGIEENYVLALDEDDAGAGSSPNEEQVAAEGSEDILVPDGDIADSEALREVQYSKHSIEAMRARLLAVMELHRHLCEQAALHDPADWQGCKRAWDQVLCWPPSQPASLTSLPCPGHVPGMDSREGAATRWCDASGQWQESPHTVKLSSSSPSPDVYAKNTYSTDLPLPESTSSSSMGTSSSTPPLRAPISAVTVRTERPANHHTNISVEEQILESFTAGWTNYTRCLAKPRKPARKVAPLIAVWLPVVRSISVAGYSISLSALVVSCAILASFRRLRCARNLLHLHLFVSFSLRAVAVLLKAPLLSPASVAAASTYDLDEETSSSAWLCRLTVAVWEYFIIANYSWLLMEGLYLHNLIFRALFADSSAVLPYVALGWGLPLVVILCWSIARSVVDNSHCWLVHFNPWPHWLGLRLPVAISVFLNLFFFLNIVRVLASKLSSPASSDNGKFKSSEASTRQRVSRLRKLSRSTLVLVPLFGIHYCLLWGLSLSSHPPVELAWLLLDQVCSSFQGLVVAVLYCFMNGEVRQELRKLRGAARRDDDLGHFGTSYSTVLSRAKASMASLASLHGSSDRTVHSPPSEGAPPTPPVASHRPHTPPRLVKKCSEDFISLDSVPEERLEMQIYSPKAREFEGLPPQSGEEMLYSAETDVLSASELCNGSIAPAEDHSSHKYHVISTTSFMPASIIHVSKGSDTTTHRRASLDRGIIASKSLASKQRPPLVKKLSFQEPVKGLPFLGEILTPEKAKKANLSSSTTSGMNSHLGEQSELSSLLPFQSSRSLTTVDDRPLVNGKSQAKSTKLPSLPLRSRRLNKSSGASGANRLKKLILSRGSAPYPLSV